MLIAIEGVVWRGQTSAPPADFAGGVRGRSQVRVQPSVPALSTSRFPLIWPSRRCTGRTGLLWLFLIYAMATLFAFDRAPRA